MGNIVEVIKVPEAVVTPVNDISASEWLQVSAAVAALSHNTYDPVTYGAERDDPGAASANVTAINTAAQQAAINNGVLTIKGTYYINDTVQFQCHVDGSSGNLRTTNLTIDPAVLVGSLTSGVRLHDKHIILPGIWQDGKTGAGWGELDTGLVVSNAYSCNITITGVHNFSVGTRNTAKGEGNVYNTFFLGIMENNKIGLEITTEDGTGWCNESVWIGGRFQINSNEGNEIAGAAHIAVRGTAYVNNNHLLLKPSIEGNGPGYHLDINGRYITVVQARYETPVGASPRVRLGANSNGTVFDNGYGLHTVEWTISPGGGVNTTILHRQGQRLHMGAGAAGTLVLENSASNGNPALLVMPAGSGPDADPGDHVVSITANNTTYKGAADSTPRIVIDHINGRVRAEGLGTAGYTAGAPAGSPIGTVPIYNKDGVLLGRVPVY